MNKVLIIILTESGKPEWERAWAIAARPDAMNASLDEKGEVIRLDLPECLILFIREDEVEDLVSLTRECLDDWRQEENYLAVHGLRDYIEKADDRRLLRERVNAMINFHHMEEVSSYNNFMKALSGVLEPLEAGGREPARKVGCQELKQAILDLSEQTRGRRVSVLKHKVANCFLPVDIDLQGWKETGFDSAYGQEIATAYKDGLLRPLEQAREHLYKGQYSLKELAKPEDAEAGSARREVEWLLPETDSDSADKAEAFADASRILGLLHQDDLDRVREMLSDADPFHAWFEKLMESLDRLRNVISNG